MKKTTRLWITRALIFPVLFFNVQCALFFLLSPGLYAPAFDLSGVIGDVVMRGFGILFLMWNVPYFNALLQPYRHFTSLSEAVCMQLIGALGETILLAHIPITQEMLRASIMRFAYFDGAGLVLLAIAWFVAAHSTGFLCVKDKGA